MEILNLGEVIATRNLYLIGSSSKIEIKIGKPARFSDAFDYYCPYQIIGIGTEKIKYAGGIDAVQALWLALHKIGAELYTSREAKTGLLRWEGDENGILGFPVMDNLEDLIPESNIDK